MKKSLGSLVAVNRRALLLLGIIFSMAVFGIATWRASAWSKSFGSAESVSQAQPVAAQSEDSEWVRAMEDHVKNGTFEMLSSAKQTQLQIKSGMKFEDGVLKPGISNDVRPYKQLFDLKRIEALADSQSILAALANPLVNNPAADTTAQVTQSESTVLLVGGNNLVASFNDSGSFLGGVNSFTGYSTTTDQGATWTDRGIVPLLGQQNFGDPVLARSAATGTVFLSTLSGGANGMNIYRSTDNGVTFTSVADGAPGAASAGTDKEWIAVDNFAGAGNGNVYHAYRDFGAPNGIYFTRSVNDGVGYSAPILIDSGADSNVQGPFVVVGANHAVYVVYYDSLGAPDTIKVRRSTDLGLTFGATITISNLVTTGTNGNLNVPAGYRSNAFPSCAVNPANANMLACVHGDVTAPGGPNSNIIYNQSTDGGATWSANVQLNTDAGTNAQTHPAMTWMPDGSALSASWQDSRADPANRRVQRFGVIGTVAGTVVTFGPNFQISQPNWTPSFGVDPAVNTVYMGDYDTMDANNTNFFTTFTDCRLQPPSGQDVRFASIPKAGPGAVIGFASSTPTALNPANNTCTDVFATLANNGTAAANGVTANFTTTTAGVTLTQNMNVPYGTIAAGGSATNTTPVMMSVASNFVCGTTIVINVAASTGDNFSFNITTQGLGYQTTTLNNQTVNGGTVNVGNAGDDVVTSGIPIPFPFQFNGVGQTAINVSSNGNAQFTSANTTFTNVCPLPSAAFSNALYGHWDDLHTGASATGCAPYPGITCGIFTSTTGAAPNRVFNIEWRARTFSGPTSPIAFEIRLYETTGVIEYVYANVTGNATNTNGSSASVGVQRGTGAGANDVTQFSCNMASLSNGLLVRFTPVSACPQGQGACVAGNSADLSITKTDGVTTVNPGQMITYTIVARNNGPSIVTGATVTDNFPTPALTGVNWTCVGAGGGTCPAGGAGNINALVNLPVGGTATFTATATVSPTATFGFSNVATITPPMGTTDPVPGNNSARDTDTICAVNPARTTFTQQTPVAIPTGPAVVTSTVFVSGAGAYLYDLNMSTNLTHTFAADLDITIQSPAGTIVTLTTDNGAGNDNVFNGTVWDDDANPTGQVPYATNNGLVTDHAYVNLTTATPLVPEEAMGAFIGENPNGTWTITISDDLAGDGGSLDSWSLDVGTFGAAPTQTVVPTVTNNTPVAIPTGPAVVTSTVAVAGATGSILDVNLTTLMNHTFSADLDVTLTSPAGTVVTLTTDNGGANDNVFNGTVWDDDANPAGQVPYVTNNGLVTDHLYANLTTATPLVPEEAMGAFIGENPNGTWTITISDDRAGDGGSLDSWSLNITTATFSCPPTAAGVTVSGRILTPQGYGLRNAIVTITDSTGTIRTARTGSFGYYSFDEVEVGGTYVVSVGSKRFAFTPRILTVNDSVSDFDFIAQASE